MDNELTGPLTLRAAIETWPLTQPFRISGYTWEVIEVLAVSLEKDGKVGCGEAAGVHYRKETASVLLSQIDALRAKIESGLTRGLIQSWLPPGGARNALDCAFWDLEARLTGRPAWQTAGLKAPQPLLTTFTCGVDEPENVAATARAYRNARAIKVKLNGDTLDTARVRAVRDALPDVWLGVDANQALTLDTFAKLLPALTETGVALIEQPFPAGQERLLDGLVCPIPFAADESVQSLSDLAALAGRFQVINIKLDKCGGLTEGLRMARSAQELGMASMVGNMIGTSLAMAPAFLLGQLCRIVDLDGPVFLKFDRSATAMYENGHITCPRTVWG